MASKLFFHGTAIIFKVKHNYHLVPENTSTCLLLCPLGCKDILGDTTEASNAFKVPKVTHVNQRYKRFCSPHKLQIFLIIQRMAKQKPQSLCFVPDTEVTIPAGSACTRKLMCMEAHLLWLQFAFMANKSAMDKHWVNIGRANSRRKSIALGDGDWPPGCCW